MGLKEAQRILKEKFGVHIQAGSKSMNRSRRNGSRLQESIGIAGKRRDLQMELNGDIGPVQRLILIAERELRDWLEVSVYLPSENEKASFRELVSFDFEDRTSSSQTQITQDQLQNTSGPSLDSSTSISEPSASKSLTSLKSNTNLNLPQLAEISRHPHSLIWFIQDNFLRLAIHCLARIYGCCSFSKNSSSKTSPISGIRQTFILNPNPLAREPGSNRRRGRDRTTRRRSGSNSSEVSVGSEMSEVRRVGGGRGLVRGLGRGLIETPPTTDIGTDIEGGSVVWESEGQSETSSLRNLESSDSEKDGSGSGSGDGLSDVGESSEVEIENQDEIGNDEIGDMTLKPETSTIEKRLEKTHISSPLANIETFEAGEEEEEMEAYADCDSDSDAHSGSLDLAGSVENLR